MLMTCYRCVSDSDKSSGLSLRGGSMDCGARDSGFRPGDTYTYMNNKKKPILECIFSYSFTIIKLQCIRQSPELPKHEIDRLEIKMVVFYGLINFIT